MSDSSSLETLATQPQLEQPITQQQSRLAGIDTLNFPEPSDNEEAIYSFQGSAQLPRQTGSSFTASKDLDKQPIKTKIKARFSPRTQKRKGAFSRLKKVVKRLITAIKSLVRFFRN